MLRDRHMCKLPSFVSHLSRCRTWLIPRCPPHQPGQRNPQLPTRIGKDKSKGALRCHFGLRLSYLSPTYA